MEPFVPKAPADGVIAIDVLPRASTPRKPGRPSMKRLERSGGSSTPSSRHALSSSNSSPTPTKRARSRSLDSLHAAKLHRRSSISPSPLLDIQDVFTELADGTASQERSSFEAWCAQAQNDNDHRMVGDLSYVTPSRPAEEDVWKPLVDSHRTPGLKSVPGVLKALRMELSEGDGYVRMTLPVLNLVRFFDEMKLDYNLLSHTLSKKASIEWLTDPGLFAGDVRARQMSMHVNRRTTRHLHDQVIWRAVFQCNGACKAVARDKGNSLPLYSQHGVAAEQLVDFISKRREPRIELAVPPAENEEGQLRETTSRVDHCSVKLVIEMTVKQCSDQTCTIIKMSDDAHPPTSDTSQLRMSARLRTLLHNGAGALSMTASGLRNFYTNSLLDNNTHVKWLQETAPYRLPVTKDFWTAVRTARQKEKLDANPLVGIEILYSRRPEVFIARFECVIATPHSLAVAIMQIPRMGMYMDSSWRNKNAHRCPLTMLVTLNEYHRMIPIATMISDHADEEAYALMLSQVKRAASELASRLLDEPSLVKIEGISHSELLDSCRAVAERGLKPRFMMIDGDDAERLAIRRVFPDAPIRACQFHIMQTCRSRARRVFGRLENADHRAAKFMEAFRQCQRCPSARQWDQYYNSLREKVNEISEGDPGAWETLDKWMRKSWFNPRWRAWSVDYGLPPEVTRDGPWSTNNYSEASFRVFDRVFLSCRANKRLDRLISIIINAYFPFYERVPQNVSRAPVDLENTLFEGIKLWETDCVRPCPAKMVPARVASQHDISVVYCVLPPRRQDGRSSERQYCGRNANGRLFCSCRSFDQTGKNCVHLWSMASFELCGPVQAFEENSIIIQDFLKKRSVKKTQKTDRADGEDEADIDDREDEDEEYALYWGQALHESSALSSLELNGIHSRASLLSQSNSTSVSQGHGAPGSTSVPSRTNASSRPTPASQDTSPIMRRHAQLRYPNNHLVDPESIPTDQNPSGTISLVTETRQKSQPEEAVPDRAGLSKSAVDLDKRTSTSVELRGRPSNVQPLHPWRNPQRQRQASSLRPSATAERKLEKPTGAINTGLDCYWTALFQLLTRDKVWLASLQALTVRGRFNNDPVIALLHRFIGGQSVNPAIAFPDARQILARKHLVRPNAENVMDDPNWLLLNLTTYMDRLTSSSMFGSLFELQIVSRVKCPQCNAFSVVRERSYTNTTLFIHAKSETSDQVEPHLPNMIKTALSASDYQTESVCSECQRKEWLTPSAHLSSWSPFLTLNIVWNRERTNMNVPPEQDRGRVVRNRAFPIPSDLELDRRHLFQANAGERQKYIYDLSGIVCGSGDGLDSGHYVAIVQHQGKWWLMDDDRVSISFSPQRDANEYGRYPVLILYRKRLATVTSSTFRDAISAANATMPVVPRGVGQSVVPPPGESYASPQRPATAWTDSERSATASTGVGLAGGVVRVSSTLPKNNLEPDLLSNATLEKGRMPDSSSSATFENASPADLPSTATLENATAPDLGTSALEPKSTRPVHPAFDDYFSHQQPPDASKMHWSAYNEAHWESVETDYAEQDAYDAAVAQFLLDDAEWLRQNGGSLTGKSSHPKRRPNNGEAAVPPPSTATQMATPQMQESTGIYTTSTSPAINEHDLTIVPRPVARETAAIDRSALLPTTTVGASAPPGSAAAASEADHRRSAIGHRATTMKTDLPDTVSRKSSDTPEPIWPSGPNGPLRQVAFEPSAQNDDIRLKALRSFMDVYDLHWNPPPKTRGFLSIGLMEPSQFRSGATPTIPPDVYDKIAKASLAKAKPSPGMQLGSGLIPTRVKKVFIEAEDLQRMGRPRGWWTNFMCQTICQLAGEQVNTGRWIPPPAQITEFKQQLFPINPETRLPDISLSREVLPWPGLGKNSNWRTRTTVTIVNSSPDSHLVTLAIFGPQRVTIVYDGAGGMYDLPQFQEKWRTLLAERLDYEREAGWVTSADNEGWMYMPNTMPMRDALGWLVQSDAHSCGPIATAAAVLLLRGMRPTPASLGNLPTSQNYMSSSASMLLRDSLFQMALLDSISATSTPPSWMEDDYIRHAVLNWGLQFREGL
ncbi:hypothetical protein P7C73_g1632, partial [Tremellales sp. Uapishka_1]